VQKVTSVPRPTPPADRRQADISYLRRPAARARGVRPVAQAAGQPVEFPDDERVAVLQCFETTEEGRALGVFSGALVLKDFLASGFFQGGELQGGILVHSRDADVAVFHAHYWLLI
jgi:hypothetical protein